MTFRDHTTALLARVEQLEGELADREREIAVLRGGGAPGDGEEPLEAEATANAMATKVLRANRRLTAELEEKDEAIRGLEARLEALGATAKGKLEADLRAARSQVETLREALARAEREGRERATRLAKAEGAAAERERLTAEVARLEGAHRGSEHLGKLLGSRVRELEAQLFDLRGRLREAESRIAAARRALGSPVDPVKP